MYGMTKHRNAGLSPFAAQDRWGNLWDRMFEDFPLETGESVQMPKVRLSEDADNYYLRAEMPGVNNDEVNLEYHDGILTLTAKHEDSAEEKDGETVIYNEQRQWHFRRSFRLPDADADKADADLKNGILTVSLPKSAQSKPKQISLKKG